MLYPAFFSRFQSQEYVDFIDDLVWKYALFSNSRNLAAYSIPGAPTQNRIGTRRPAISMCRVCHRCQFCSPHALLGAPSSTDETAIHWEALHSSSSRRDRSRAIAPGRAERESGYVLTFHHRSLPGRGMGACSEGEGSEGGRDAEAKRRKVDRRERRRGSKRSCHRDLASCSGSGGKQWVGVETNPGTN
jgi:hypothetical protein